MTVKAHLIVDMKVTLELNEREANALDALVGYGTDAFLKVFYEHMGKAYLQPHEAGLRALFEKITSEVSPARGIAEEARKQIAAARKAKAQP